MFVQGDFSPLFRPGLRRDFRDSYEDWQTEYTDFLRVDSTTEPEIRGTYYAGLNRLYERGDGEPIGYQDPKFGKIAVAVDKEFAGGFMVTRKTVEDDHYDKANQGAKWLAQASRKTYEVQSATLLDDAATGNVFKSWDNQPLLSTAHPLLRSSATVANTPASQVALSMTGISALLDLWTVMKDENGDPIREWPDTLVYGTNPGDINTVLAIMNSQLQPFTADNTDNVLKRRLPNLKPVVSHWKVSQKSYFLNSTKLNDAHFTIRRAVEFDDTYDFDTDVMKNKATTRFMIYVFDWRGWSGCTPT